MPLKETIKTANDSTIGLWQIEESIKELLAKYQLKEFEKERFSIIKSEKRQKEWIAARILLEILLGNKTAIGYLPNGKPYLINTNINISISHTANLVAVIINPILLVAIDIEQISEKVTRVKHKFLSSNELTFIALHKQPTLSMLLAWSAKETLYKLAGKENIDFINAYCLTPFTTKKKGIIEATYTTLTPPLSIQLHYQRNAKSILVYAETNTSF